MIKRIYFSLETDDRWYSESEAFDSGQDFMEGYINDSGLISTDPELLG